MNHRQWKKNYKKRYGYNPPAYMDKRKRRKARAQQSLPCAGISVEQITQAMETFTEAVFTAAGNICDALAQMFGRQAQAFNAVAEQYKDDKAGAVHEIHAALELYTDKVADGSLEKEIEEKVLFDVDYTKYQDTIESEDMVQTAYEFTIYEKVRKKG